ncbi:hypothetical protein HOY82DRAFT_560972 [Tuber indicum]|nr:hypothetical protein HOY82DRAFT_560972 [Tuber indicum]
MRYRSYWYCLLAALLDPFIHLPFRYTFIHHSPQSPLKFLISTSSYATQLPALVLLLGL